MLLGLGKGQGKESRKSAEIRQHRGGTIAMCRRASTEESTNEQPRAIINEVRAIDRTARDIVMRQTETLEWET